MRNQFDPHPNCDFCQVSRAQTFLQSPVERTHQQFFLVVRQFLSDSSTVSSGVKYPQKVNKKQKRVNITAKLIDF